MERIEQTEMKVISKQRNSRMCYVCGMDNPAGMHAQFYNMEDGSVMTVFRFREEQQSYPQRVHGGQIATMLDELSGRALWTAEPESLGVTTKMELKYRKPVPYDVDLIGKGTLVKNSESFARMEAVIMDSEHQVLASAVANYLKLPIDQIAENAGFHQEMCYLIEDGVTELP